jgi:hypothetical protein
MNVLLPHGRADPESGVPDYGTFVTIAPLAATANARRKEGS